MVDNNEARLDRIFSALSDRTRRKMLSMLTRGSLNITELGEPFGMTKQAISKHLKVLEDAGLILKEKDGRIQHCNFNPLAIETIQKMVDQYRKYWTHQMDALGNYIESVNKQKKEKNK